MKDTTFPPEIEHTEAAAASIVNGQALYQTHCAVCHGAGGMTAHYAFGARTGKAPIAMGTALLGVAVILGSGLAALDAVDRGDTAGALALLPVATAAAGDPARADSLLFVYGMTLVRVRDFCLTLEAFQRAMPEAVQTEAG